MQNIFTITKNCSQVMQFSQLMYPQNQKDFTEIYRNTRKCLDNWEEFKIS